MYTFKAQKNMNSGDGNNAPITEYVPFRFLTFSTSLLSNDNYKIMHYKLKLETQFKD